MRRGFTLIELLVASTLMGMLVTILTMIFNQSSIAWQVGEHGVANLKKARVFIGKAQDQLDNALLLPGGKVYRSVSPWVNGSSSSLPERAVVDASGEFDSEVLGAIKGATDGDVSSLGREMSVPSGSGSDTKFETYIVNVKSGGPRNDITDWEAIWSYPDDPSEW